MSRVHVKGIDDLPVGDYNRLKHAPTLLQHVGSGVIYVADRAWKAGAYSVKKDYATGRIDRTEQTAYCDSIGEPWPDEAQERSA